jgi:hypothetical protein
MSEPLHAKERALLEDSLAALRLPGLDNNGGPGDLPNEIRLLLSRNTELEHLNEQLARSNEFTERAVDALLVILTKLASEFDGRREHLREGR